MVDAVTVVIEYNQFIFQCPTDVEGFMCDLNDPCPECPLLSDIKRRDSG